MANPKDDRRRHRQVALECGALIDLLHELYPARALPKLNATDREIGAWLAQQELIERLEALRAQNSDIPQLLGG